MTLENLSCFLIFQKTGVALGETKQSLRWARFELGCDKLLPPPGYSFGIEGGDTLPSPHFGLPGRKEGENWQMRSWVVGASLESYENQCFPVSHNLTVFPSQVSAAGRLACTSVLDAQLLRFSQAIKQWPSTLSQRWDRPEAAWGNEPGLGPVPAASQAKGAAQKPRALPLGGGRETRHGAAASGWIL